MIWLVSEGNKGCHGNMPTWLVSISYTDDTGSFLRGTRVVMVNKLVSRGTRVVVVKWLVSISDTDDTGSSLRGTRVVMVNKLVSRGTRVVVVTWLVSEGNKGCHGKMARLYQ